MEELAGWTCLARISYSASASVPVFDIGATVLAEGSGTAGPALVDSGMAPAKTSASVEWAETISVPAGKIAVSSAHGRSQGIISGLSDATDSAQEECKAAENQLCELEVLFCDPLRKP